ncbi:uncharacterized protein KZ484_007241 [Pholidichthys leucotaenia]
MAKDITLLYSAGSPPCWRVMITLEEKNLQGYNQKLLSFEKGEHKSKEVMDVNPRGQVPSLKCKDYILNESCAACVFLECHYKSQGNNLTPECPKELAQMYQRMLEGLTLYQKMMDTAGYNWKVPEGERHDSALKRLREGLTEEMKLWEGYLQQGPYLAGKTFSLADVVVFPTIAVLFRFGLCEKRYANLAKYLNCLKERPSIKASWPPNWNEELKGGPPRDLLKDILYLSGKTLHSKTMAKDMTLLWASGSLPCWRVMITMEKSLQGYKHKLLSFEKREHKCKEVMDINPRYQLLSFICKHYILNEYAACLFLEKSSCFKMNHKEALDEKQAGWQSCQKKVKVKLPSLKWKDSCLNDSYAACFFFECHFKSQGNKLTPDCPKELAQMLQRAFEGMTFIQKIIDVIAYDWRVPENERHDTAVKRNRECLCEELKLWEKYLQDGPGPYLAGKDFSLADVLIFPNIAFLFRFGLCEQRFPKITEYYKCLIERPSIKATWPPLMEGHPMSG